MLETVDIEHCIWDLEYRRRVKRLLAVPPEDVRKPANQNRDMPCHDGAPAR